MAIDQSPSHHRSTSSSADARVFVFIVIILLASVGIQLALLATARFEACRSPVGKLVLRAGPLVGLRAAALDRAATEPSR